MNKSQTSCLKFSNRLEKLFKAGYMIILLLIFAVSAAAAAADFAELTRDFFTLSEEKQLHNINEIEGTFRDSATVDFLIEVLHKTTNQAIKATVARQLGILSLDGPPDRREDISDALIKALDDQAPFVRERVFRALGKAIIGNPSAKIVNALLKTSHEQDAWVRATSLGSIYFSGLTEEDKKRVSDRALELFSDPDPTVQAAALTLLGEVKPLPAAVKEKLRPMLDHPDRNIRAQSVRIMGGGSIDGQANLEFVPDLIRVLQSDSDPFVRGDAARSLAWLKADGALEPLKEAIKKESSIYLIRFAIFALEEIGDKSAGETLWQLYQTPGHVDAEFRRDAQSTALEAIGKLRLSEYLPNLWQIVDDDLAKGVSEVGLGTIRAIIQINSRQDDEKFIKILREYSPENFAQPNGPYFLNNVLVHFQKLQNPDALEALKQVRGKFKDEYQTVENNIKNATELLEKRFSADSANTTSEPADSEPIKNQAVKDKSDDDLTGKLFAAIKNGDTATVKSLIEKGAPVSPRNDSGMTPLMAAAYFGNREIAAFLLSKKASPDEINYRNGTTPLMLATLRRHVEIIKLLAAAKADLNQSDKRGQTALMIARQKKFADIEKLLLQLGALQ
ncbi:MAG: HEAT repeat domain-containing protein [Candidatus Riflebacteria bacterium]